MDIFTAATLLDDVPTTFWFDQQPYEPTNFDQQFRGEVTLRRALSKSLNVATIQLAERVGYGSVVRMARSCRLQPGDPADPRGCVGRL